MHLLPSTYRLVPAAAGSVYEKLPARDWRLLWNQVLLFADTRCLFCSSYCRSPGCCWSAWALSIWLTFQLGEPPAHLCFPVAHFPAVRLVFCAITGFPFLCWFLTDCSITAFDSLVRLNYRVSNMVAISLPHLDSLSLNSLCFLGLNCLHYLL